jgi:hypothetical protein
MAATQVTRKEPSSEEAATRKLSIQDRRESFIADVHKTFQAAKTEKPFVAKNMTPYQAEKLKALFEKYYDVDKDGIITGKDFEMLNEKFIDFTGWNPEDVKLRKLLDYHQDLYRCLLMEVNKDVHIEEHKTNEITLNAWMKMWDRLMKGALALIHLPQWVQVMPFNLFTYMDKHGMLFQSSSEKSIPKCTFDSYRRRPHKQAKSLRILYRFHVIG